jgi:hypothetical protein
MVKIDYRRSEKHTENRVEGLDSYMRTLDEMDPELLMINKTATPEVGEGMAWTER